MRAVVEGEQLSGSVRMDPDTHGSVRTFRRGDIIVLTLGAAAGEDREGAGEAACRPRATKAEARFVRPARRCKGDEGAP
jgi:hypothetical protein